MLFDFQGQEMNSNFEVERDAMVGPISCGAWFMGEYYIIDASLSYYTDSGFIRMVKILNRCCRFHSLTHIR